MTRRFSGNGDRQLDDVFFRLVPAAATAIAWLLRASLERRRSTRRTRPEASSRPSQSRRDNHRRTLACLPICRVMSRVPARWSLLLATRQGAVRRCAANGRRSLRASCLASLNNAARFFDAFRAGLGLGSRRRSVPPQGISSGCRAPGFGRRGNGQLASLDHPRQRSRPPRRGRR